MKAIGGRLFVRVHHICEGGNEQTFAAGLRPHEARRPCASESVSQSFELQHIRQSRIKTHATQRSWPYCFNDPEGTRDTLITLECFFYSRSIRGSWQPLPLRAQSINPLGHFVVCQSPVGIKWHFLHPAAFSRRFFILPSSTTSAIMIRGYSISHAAQSYKIHSSLPQECPRQTTPSHPTQIIHCFLRNMNILHSIFHFQIFQPYFRFISLSYYRKLVCKYRSINKIKFLLTLRYRQYEKNTAKML